MAISKNVWYVCWLPQKGTKKEGYSLDNKENGRGYTIDELLSEMEPRYNAYKKTMRECIAGLTSRAAQLSAQGQEE